MMNDRISYATIIAAKKGNAEAMDQIIKHYTPFIVSRSKRRFYDEFENVYHFVDKSIVDLITAKLMYAIVYHFDTERMPEGERQE